jgi:hypothetical protein
MKGFGGMMQRFEAVMNAVSFAEEGEWETARALYGEGLRKRADVRKEADRNVVRLSARSHR